MGREIASLREHYIIYGAGRVGHSVAHELSRKPGPFVTPEPIQGYDHLSAMGETPQLAKLETLAATAHRP